VGDAYWGVWVGRRLQEIVISLACRAHALARAVLLFTQNHGLFKQTQSHVHLPTGHHITEMLALASRRAAAAAAAASSTGKSSVAAFGERAVRVCELLGCAV